LPIWASSDLPLCGFIFRSARRTEATWFVPVAQVKQRGIGCSWQPILLIIDFQSSPMPVIEAGAPVTGNAWRLPAPTARSVTGATLDIAADRNGRPGSCRKRPLAFFQKHGSQHLSDRQKQTGFDACRPLARPALLHARTDRPGSRVHL
jgi:hypothetical protein